MTEARNNFDTRHEVVLPDFTDITERGLYVPELEHDA